MLPYDILRNISLHLNPYELSICKELYNMYNDFWYENKLKLLCPNVNLFGNSKDLYKKYLKQGDIFILYGDNLQNLDIKGTKICMMSNNSGRMALTFDGNLYINNILIDKNVIDIDIDTYIKNNEWYVQDENDKWIKMEINDRFIKVNYDWITCCPIVIGENGVYIDDESKVFDIKIINVYTEQYPTYFSDAEDNAYIITDNKNLEKTNLKLKSNNVLYDDTGPIIIVSRDYNFVTLHVIFDGYIEKMCYDYIGKRVFILNGGILYFCNIYKDSNTLHNWKLFEQDVKNIYIDNWIYIIK